MPHNYFTILLYILLYMKFFHVLIFSPLPFMFLPLYPALSRFCFIDRFPIFCSAFQQSLENTELIASHFGWQNEQ